MLRVPAPFLLAVVVATAAVTIYLHLTVISVPAVGDGNFTGTLVAGSHYLWRGSAGTIDFESNETIGLTYYVFGYVVHLNGEPGNVTVNSNVRIFYFASRGYPILYVYNAEAYRAFLFKLINAATIGGITVYVPQTFDQFETLTYAERDSIGVATGNYNPYRVVSVSTNGTHLIVFSAYSTSGYTTETDYLRLPSPTMGTNIRTTFNGIGFSYIIGSQTYSGYAMPYVYFVITPQANTQVRIYLR
jgi:hypothetical protein